MVLPSGLKATLTTLPSFTGSGSSTSRLRAARSHSTTPPRCPLLTQNPAAMVLPSGLKATLATLPLYGKWLVDQSFASGQVPEHHAATVPAADVESGRDGLAVWAEGHAPNVALFHGEWLVASRLRAARSQSTTPPPPPPQ